MKGIWSEHGTKYSSNPSRFRSQNAEHDLKDDDATDDLATVKVADEASKAETVSSDTDRKRQSKRMSRNRNQK